MIKLSIREKFMYALIVKNSQGIWDVWNTLPSIPFAEREDRLQAAIRGEFPIIGRNVTDHKASVKSGAIWDGEKFSGGEIKKIITEESHINVYAYLCNNVVVLLQFGEPGTELDYQLQAIFESDTTVINIPKGQTAKPGDLWDGLNIIKTNRGEG
jgi:hypothetical protein